MNPNERSKYLCDQYGQVLGGIQNVTISLKPVFFIFRAIGSEKITVRAGRVEQESSGRKVSLCQEDRFRIHSS